MDGTVDEFSGGLSRRWNANGGDSNVRYRSAIRSLAAWERVMRRCSFDTMDAFEFIPHCVDAQHHGLYVDPPWPDDGKYYRHTFDQSAHERLAELLGGFKEARIVIRFGDHPLIRRLYPEPRWTWRRQKSRTQVNEDKDEILILNGPSRVRMKESLF